jgi:hypothetical protein
VARRTDNLTSPKLTGRKTMKKRLLLASLSCMALTGTAFADITFKFEVIIQNPPVRPQDDHLGDWTLKVTQEGSEVAALSKNKPTVTHTQSWSLPHENMLYGFEFDGGYYPHMPGDQGVQLNLPCHPPHFMQGQQIPNGSTYNIVITIVNPRGPNDFPPSCVATLQ